MKTLFFSVIMQQK